MIAQLQDPVPAGPFTGVPLAVVATRLRDGTADPVALAEHALAAIDATQPAINAFVTVDRDGALKAASNARDELASGTDRGPLHGVPVAVKDLVDTAGLRTTMGSRHFADHVPDRDAEVVRRLRTAGAVIVGKTTTHEFAYGPTGDRAANGPGANPRDPGRMAGGSSAGSAAAVAAGLVPLAVGTDTGGSVRIPAALCGVTGIRPSYGRIPLDGVFPLSGSLDSVGPMAADVAGTAVGWQVLAGEPVAPLSDVDLATVRIGIPTHRWFERPDTPVRAAFDGLVGRLDALGAKSHAVSMPDAEELADLYRIVQSAEAAVIHRERLAAAPELFDPEVLERLHTAAEVSRADYERALARLTEVRARAAGRFDGIDLYLLATVPIVAPPLGVRDGDLGAGWTSPRVALLAHNTPWSVLGLPAISIPLPSSGSGTLPVGAQLVGAPGGDVTLLATARAVEAAIRG
jgi:aspartyl-tRNA(Asn)/glutamyl-tRNA(Gln) amidotransferase subunit A